MCATEASPSYPSSTAHSCKTDAPSPSSSSTQHQPAMSSPVPDREALLCALRAPAAAPAVLALLQGAAARIAVPCSALSKAPAVGGVGSKVVVTVRGTKGSELKLDCGRWWRGAPLQPVFMHYHTLLGHANTDTLAALHRKVIANATWEPPTAIRSPTVHGSRPAGRGVAGAATPGSAMRGVGGGSTNRVGLQAVAMQALRSSPCAAATKRTSQPMRFPARTKEQHQQPKRQLCGAASNESPGLASPACPSSPEESATDVLTCRDFSSQGSTASINASPQLSLGRSPGGSLELSSELSEMEVAAAGAAAVDLTPPRQPEVGADGGISSGPNSGPGPSRLAGMSGRQLSFGLDGAASIDSATAYENLLEIENKVHEPAMQGEEEQQHNEPRLPGSQPMTNEEMQEVPESLNRM